MFRAGGWKHVVGMPITLSPTPASWGEGIGSGDSGGADEIRPQGPTEAIGFDGG